MTRRHLVAVAALITAGLVATPGAATSAPATSGNAAAPVAATTSVPDGVLMSYIINARNASPGQTRKVEAAVMRAGGVVVQSWREIGVVVAHSDRAAFAERVAERGGKAVESLGATRTSEVVEGTPEGIETPWRSPGSAAERGGQHGQPVRVVRRDPRESEQWALTEIGADRAHRLTDGSRHVRVAVMDTGIDPTHPDLAANIDASRSVNCTDAGRPDRSPTGWHNTVSGHGTHVAGIIAADRNGTGIVGVAPNVRVSSVKVSGDENLIFPEYAVCGFMWVAEHGFDVSNSSYYVDPVEFWCTSDATHNASIQAVRKAVAYATKQGVAHVAAAGNSATDLTEQVDQGCVNMPASLPGVTAVSATTEAGGLASFSSRGRGVIDVGAPGDDVLSTIPDGQYAAWGGTSMASPQVAGVLALMKSAHPNWVPRRLQAALRRQADDRACPAEPAGDGAACAGPASDNSYFGDGIVDALDAVR